MDIDTERMCRICLDVNKETSDIFNSYYSKKNILYSEMIMLCTKYQISEEDGLPRLICKECSRHLKKAYAFYILYETSYHKLKQFPNNKLEPDKLKLENLHEDLENDAKPDEHKIKENNSVKHDSTEEVKHDEDNETKLKKEVKDEPANLYDDDLWDAEDDTVLCNVIKSTSPVVLDISALLLLLILCIIVIMALVTVPKYRELKTNKKHGFRLKVNNEELKGELDINLVVEKPKSKRGRKKKEYENGIKPKSESKEPHQCHICGKILSTRSNLKAHNLCHTDLRPYKCDTCQATFRGYSALFHHKKTHTKETPFHCEYCPKQFSRRSNLVDHVRMHLGEKSFNCSICCKKFTQRAQLAIHLKRHKGDKSYLCQDCGKGFPVKADLKVHQRIHNGEKPYACHLCTKTFATSGNLSIHVRIHKKEIRYTCDLCNRGFVTSSSYNVHLKRHKGQRDYHCYCGKTFFTSSALKQHKVTHTGEKKYQCKICDRKFSQTSHLNRHFKKDHAKHSEPLPSSDQYRVVLQEANSAVITMIKHSEPLPSSDQYRVDLQEANSAVITMINSDVSEVKCEGT